MTADLTPAQAARHEIVVEVYDGIAIGMRCCTCHERIPIRPERAAITVGEVNYLATEHQPAVAAIDVMRGAADDGAIGRVLALADELDGGFEIHGDEVARLIRAAVGAPATAEGDDCTTFDCRNPGRVPGIFDADDHPSRAVYCTECAELLTFDGSFTPDPR